eukprot:TRINITY_DN3139_c0_g1_i7.p1 TRINITY_DN3139_c0_g1~~TRINITY_DN3139_c0_g1_i7.p1  ORF type:complete len:283 (-),score=66.59 TRINITY_DN3139_c0_g1_i7:2-850(-)
MQKKLESFEDQVARYRSAQKGISDMERALEAREEQRNLLQQQRETQAQTVERLKEELRQKSRELVTAHEQREADLETLSRKHDLLNQQMEVNLQRVQAELRQARAEADRLQVDLESMRTNWRVKEADYHRDVQELRHVIRIAEAEKSDREQQIQDLNRRLERSGDPKGKTVMAQREREAQEQITLLSQLNADLKRRVVLLEAAAEHSSAADVVRLQGELSRLEQELRHTRARRTVDPAPEQGLEKQVRDLRLLTTQQQRTIDDLTQDNRLKDEVIASLRRRG